MTRAHLSWSRPAASSCPSAALLEREVEELAGHRVFGPEAEADVVVRGGIEETEAGPHAWFEARAADGTLVGRRDLVSEDGDCASLQHTLALVLTIWLDRPAGQSQRATAQPGKEAREEASATLPAARVDPTRPGLAARLSGSAWAGLLSGSLPRVAPGAGISLELALSRSWRLRSDGAYWLPVTSEQSGVSAKFSAFAGGLSLCPRWLLGHGPVALNACAGGQLGAIAATPRGLDGPDRVSRLLALATVELGLSARVQRLTILFLSVGAAVSLTRPRFSYDRDDGSSLTLLRPASAGAIARLGLTIGRP